MDVVLKFSKGAIILRAKDETYLSTKSVLSDKERTDEQRYNMQAGDNKVHERKLLSSLGVALSELKSTFDKVPISDTMSDKKDSFNITLALSDRFKSERSIDLQRMFEEYLYRRIVADWWQTNYPELSASYLSNVSVSLDGIRRLLSLSTPNDENLIRYKCIYSCGYRNVLLYKESLLNEIHTELLKLSRSRTNETGIPDIHLQTNELEDESLLVRYINRHIGRICSRINVYLYELISGFDNEHSGESYVYKFKLVMPDKWDCRLFEQLGEEMHSYVVNAAITEWLKSYLPDMASVYGSQADSAWDNIKHIVSVRRGGLNKPLQPF